uniref:Permease n=1 Tax=Solibacter usitatus (strain Ellin6076) TaxID=234267 RepID=Q01UZ0_SOLUE
MWLRGKRAEAELSAELRYHFDRMIDDLVAAGVAPEEARRRARLEFGGVEQVKEECRDVRGRWVEDLGKDLRYAVRTLRRSPGFLLVSVLSLALGIGANTAIFSLINAVMLRTLPVAEPERLVQITRLRASGKPGVVSYPLFVYFRDSLKSVSGVTAELESGTMISMDGTEEEVSTELIWGDFYTVLRMKPAAGRLLVAGDDRAAVISYRYWQRRFGASPAALGKTLLFQDKAFTIVGVTPASYHGTTPGRDPDITMSGSMMLSERQRRDAGFNFLSMMGRLAPGVTAEQANAELQVIWQAFVQRMAAAAPEKNRPEILRQRAGVLSASGGFNWLYDDYSKALLVLMGVVGLVLLLACANLSGLLLARAASRQREISIRLAMGAGGGRLIRQFLAESLVLAALGGCAGLLVARWFSATLVGMMANGGKLLLSTAPDGRVFGFTALLSLAVCVGAGLAPGLHALRVSLNPGLKQTRGGGHRRLSRALVIAQLSISMVLLVGATLFVGTLVKLYSAERGVRTEGVLTFGVKYMAPYLPARGRAVQAAVVERLAALPGVTVASAASGIPMGGGGWTRAVQVEGYKFRADENEEVEFNVIAPRFFATVGTPVAAGREFEERDADGGRRVAIVNESFARYFFGGEPALGRRVTSASVAYEIVGVVQDVRTSLRHDVARTLYVPWRQSEGEQPRNYSFLARVERGDPMRLAPLLDRVLREADPGLRVVRPQSFAAFVDGTIVTERIMAILGGLFGLLALTVACLGIFGVTAFQVSRRTNEIGLRMALGALRGNIVLMVLREAAGMMFVGCAIGAAAALTLTGLAREMLFGITAQEPAVFAVAAAVLGAAAIAAAWLPARRASLVDPMTALRHE